MSALEKIDLGRLPQHVAIIMDGNGRWAKKRGLMRSFGHENGVTTVRQITEIASELGIGYLTLYTFSTENWNRPKDEVDALMNLIVVSIEQQTPDLIKNNVRLTTIGNMRRMPQFARAESIDDDMVSKAMATASMPDPDLLIRTAGDLRISNFLLWQIAYSELYFTPKFWPDFTKEDFCEAIVDYQSRERRFGKTSEQLK